MKDRKGIVIYHKGYMDTKCRYFKIYKLDRGSGRCLSEEAKKKMGNSTLILGCEDCEFAAHRKAK